VDINANKAVAAVKQAEGVRDSTRIRADGDAAAIIRVGTAQADAYHAQADVLGAERVALVKIFEQIQEGKVVITPETLVMTGTDGQAGSVALFSAFLATLLSGKASLPKEPFRPPPGSRESEGDPRGWDDHHGAQRVRSPNSRTPAGTAGHQRLIEVPV
jgi:hypothetical protein